MIQLPDVRRPPRRVRDWHLEVVSGVVSLSGAGLAAWKTWGNSEYRWVLWVAFGLAAATCILGIYKALRLREKENRYEPINEPKDIASWAQSAFSALDERHEVQRHATRLTVYRVEYDRALRSPQRLQQIIEYVGGAGAAAGRPMDARCGAVGVCARTGKAIAAKRTAPGLDEFREEVVRHWGFTEAEARQVSPDRQSFFAAPITDSDGGRVVAVVFLDSKHPELFDQPNVQESILEYCGFLTELIRRCYSS